MNKQERCVITLKKYPHGLTADDMLEIFSSEDGTATGFGGLPKYLSNLFDNGIVCALRKQLNGQRVYIHLDYKTKYKPIDLLHKPKKVDKRDHCLNLFEQAYLTKDTHKFELAMRALEDIRND
jgi:hypothetical protein